MSPKPEAAVKIYSFPLSGHSHRVRLFASLAGIPVEVIDVALGQGAHKKPEFLAKNAFGQVPVLEDGGTIVADSNAILVYLAHAYADESWLPRDAVGAAEVQRWLSVAAGQLNNGPASARLVNVFGAKLDHERAKSIAVGLFKVLDSALAGRSWLVGDKPTIADVALYSYTAHAPEGSVALDPYTNISAWLTRIEALPGFVPMQASKVGFAA